ncbi:probable RNA-dependent RNA polymerase 5 [Andrographis paniculata]|uniref:probable RNA-dependent RNA polymerase 5 n=1 Tax=Andrographis paniculata TaxID=175694 RepID=UPI0021E7FD30|nr:probable RNA-dependent RNA polymerase 5 [Andrographis paniculata]
MGMATPRREVLLPQSVETEIQRICREKDVDPLRAYTRVMLAEMGEQNALNMLQKIMLSPRLRSFSGFVRQLTITEYPAIAEAVFDEFGYDSPWRQNMQSSSPCSPQNLNGESLRSPKSGGSAPSRLSGLDGQIPQSVSRQLSYGDESQEKRRADVSSQSSQNGKVRSTTEPMKNSRQLMVLSELEFRKLFMVLSYIGRKSLEDVVSVDEAEEIFKMKDLPMRNFESIIWDKYGQKFCQKEDRCQFLDWDSRKTHLYYCHFFPDRSYYLRGPYLNSSRTHLQKSLGDDNVLMVKFTEGGAYDTNNIVEEGIFVGLRQYRFFVFKEGHKKAKKNQTEDKKAPYSSGCYFIHLNSEKSISEARRMFMHVHTLPSLAKYMARFSLILSKTITVDVDFAAVLIERIEDIPFKDKNGTPIPDDDGSPILHTDGTGYISEDLAMKCPKYFTRAKNVSDNHFEKFSVELENINSRRGEETRDKYPPLLMQMRLFHDGCAVKGTLLLNRKLKPGTIQIRPSMIKVEQDRLLPMGKQFSALEIVNISSRPGKSFLSKNLIALLSYGGVPQEVFLNLLTEVLEETQNVYTDRKAALRAASNSDSIGFVPLRLISCGIPLDEPYLQHCLSIIKGIEKTKLKEGKIPISESFYVMGTADPTGVLENDQVCVILDHGQISGKVLVYRNPGLHFGDVHVMEAVFVKELEEYVGNAKYGIFFSTKGCRSAAYEIATGDFDGDLYWVSRHPELLKYYEASEPWTRTYKTKGSTGKNPQEFSDLELETQLIQHFLNSMKPSFSMAAASSSWLSFMDRLLSLRQDCSSEKESLKKKMKQLIDIYYDALDAPKSGKEVTVPNWLTAELYPHHMERGPENSYSSSSILGIIYDKVVAFKNEPLAKKEIWKLPCFADPDPDSYKIWSKHHANYCREMSQALNNKSKKDTSNDSPNHVIQKYKQLLYEAPEWEESPKDSEKIAVEAVAIYNVAYDYAMKNGVAKCSFAWNVAGSTLCQMFACDMFGQKETPIAILPSVLRELVRQ